MKYYHLICECVTHGQIWRWFNTVVLVALISGCSQEPEHLDKMAGSKTQNSPQSVIAISPELNEILLELDVAEKIVGVDSLTGAKPAFKNISDLGHSCALNVAKLQAIQADLSLVLATSCGLKAAKRLKEQGIQVRVFEIQNINEYISLWHQLGKLFGKEQRARKLVTRLSQDISRIAIARDGLTRTNVVWILQHEPLMVVGATGILHDMLELAGAENAFFEPYHEARFITTYQELVAHTPDLVIDSSDEKITDLQLLPLKPRIESIPVSLADVPTLKVLPTIKHLQSVIYPAEHR